MYQILGLVFDGYQSSGIASTFDVFNVVNTLWRQRGDSGELYKCSLVSLDGEITTASNGSRTLTDYSLATAPKADLIIIPGIHHYDGKDLINKLQNLSRECAWLRQQFQQGTMIAANCSGVFLLAESEALNNQAATTGWWLSGLFQSRYPDVQLRPETLMVENPQTFCTGAMTANMGVMLQIVEQQVGRQLALACAKTMLIDATQSYASPYMFTQEQAQHEDSMILSVESWMQRHISQPLDIQSLAALHCVSARTLSRRFRKAHGISPLEYLQNIRLQHVQLLLKTTSLSIEQLVERVGYNSASSLRRLFKKELGVSPREYRQQHKELTTGG